MISLEVAHTAQLAPVKLTQAHTLLEKAFGDELSDDDWEHALGGMHALLWDDQNLIGHASVVQRRLLPGGRALRTGYVEGVAVHPDRRRQGHAATMMDALEHVIRGAYELGALGATDLGARLYTARGWQRWRGPISTLSPEGIRPTPEEDGFIYVLPLEAALDLDGELTCDWRDGDVW
jgi:aminoglycoside 2'-N-acetyltransferase I